MRKPKGLTLATLLTISGASLGSASCGMPGPSIPGPSGIYELACFEMQPPEDIDCDGIPNDLDNCPYDHNQSQRDSNNNGIGDKCEDSYSTPPVNFSPPSGNSCSSIPEGSYYGENLSTSLEITHNNVVILSEQGNNGTLSVSFDSGGWPMNYDDALNRQVRVYVGYTEESGSFPFTILNITCSGNTVIIGSDMWSDTIGVRGTNTQTFRYENGYLYTETNTYMIGENYGTFEEWTIISSGRGTGPH